MRLFKTHVYKAKDGFRWRLKSGNGRIVAESGEAYKTRAAATAGWSKVRREAFRTIVHQDKD